MHRALFICPLLLLFSLAACKKDVLKVKTWQQIDTHTTTDRLNAIYFTDDSNGYIVGGERFYKATILRTKDGGNTWTYQNIPEAGKGLAGITKAPSGILYGVGFDGKLVQSSDGGVSWSFSQIWYLPYKDLYFPTHNRGLLIAGVSYRAGFQHSIDAKGMPKPFDSVGYELNDIEMVTPQTGYVSGFGIVLKTMDSGYSWQELPVRNDNFTAISALSPQQAWTCGYNGSIFSTGDGGSTWSRLRNGNDLTFPRYRLQDIAFVNSLEGYACGENGLLIYTDDGGKHWMEYEHFTDAALRSLWLMKDGTLFLCGDNGTLFKVMPR